MIVKISSTFTKNHNSTKQASSGFTDYTVIGLKEPCTVLNPLIEISAFIPNACYAYIPAFNRYYFITNIESVTKDIWRYSMAVDVMGTYSSTILGSTQYCSRSSAGNKFLSDGLITHKENTSDVETFRNNAASGLSGSTYTLELIGSNGVQLYAVSKATIDSLMTNLFNASIYGASVVDDTVKTYFNPFQYVLSCRYFPTSIGGSGASMKFGWWDSGVSGSLISNNGETHTFTITVPSPTDTDGFYAHDPAWVTHTLLVPCCGTMNIPAFLTGETLTITLNIDYWTGQASARITWGNDEIGRMNGQAACDIRLTALSSDMSNIGSTLLVGGEKNLYTGLSFSSLKDALSNPQGSFGKALLTGLASAIDGLMPGDPIKNVMAPTPAYTTASGNYTDINLTRNAVITSRFYSPYNKTSVRSKFNYPDNTLRALSSLTGYTVCETPYLSIDGTSEELASIKAFMKGGFYIE